MGKVKRQRKQWRNIDTEDVDDFQETTTREERQGLVVEGIPDADLFYVDKGPDDSKAPKEELKVARKLQHRNRLTRAQAILQGAHSAAPITVPMKKFKKAAPKPAEKLIKQLVVTAGAQPVVAVKKAASLELWKGANGSVGKLEAAATTDVETWAANRALVPANPSKRRLKSSHPAAPAVEVDAPGCSFNPDREMHQDAVAEAVAAEMRKIYDADLRPTAPMATVDYHPETDELAALQVDIDDGEERSGDGKESGGEEEESDGDEGERGVVRKPVKQKTLKDRKRQIRRRVVEEEEATRRKEKKQRHELSQLKQLSSEVDATMAAREARRERREADKRERQAAEPPRLGKHKFEPMTVQVLATEELDEANGSLRRLKPTAMLAKERFKSLQRRGVIEPRRKATKKRGKRVEFVHGERVDKAVERQADLEEAREEVKKLKRSKTGAK